jgi:dihydrodipicolinate synthase/N-acetylneuraminate lyase
MVIAETELRIVKRLDTAHLPDVIYPVITPPDLSDFKKVISYIVAAGEGANIVFILGTNGEFYAISHDNKKRYIDVAIEEILKQKAIVSQNQNSRIVVPDRPLELAVGITGNNMEETLDLAQYAVNRGADYIVLMPIYLLRNSRGRFTRRGVTDVVNTILEEAIGNRLIPELVLYNFPAMTDGKSIRTAAWKKLAKDPRVAALKDSSGESARAQNYMRAAKENALFYIGNAKLGLEMVSDGVVAGDGNLLPVQWASAITREDTERMPLSNIVAKLIQYQHIYRENPIASFKYILYKLGVIREPFVYDRCLNLSASLADRLEKEILLDQQFGQFYRQNPAVRKS